MLAVIDEKLAAELTGNNMEIAQELLQMLNNTLPDDFAKIKQAYDAKQYTELNKQAHRLHGATCYCGVPALQAATQCLEKTAKTQNTKNIDETFEQFAFEVQRFLQAVK